MVLPSKLPSDQNNQQELEVPNAKKAAIGIVRNTLSKAIQELGADYAETGASSPSESLVSGLGGDGSVWKSTLADKMHDDIAGIVKRIADQFSAGEERAASQCGAEPEYVKWDDPRAKWRIG